MLILTDNPLADRQRGDGFAVGQRIFLADQRHMVRASAEVGQIEDGIAQLYDLQVFRDDEIFEAHGNAIHAKSVGESVLSLRKARPDQQQFREAVLRRCNYTCVLSGCDVPEALDAAHLPGKSWEAGHNLASDGIALRCDLHRLLDSGLMTIDLKGNVRCSAKHYEWLNEKIIILR